jgi:hypothetical protein
MRHLRVAHFSLKSKARRQEAKGAKDNNAQTSSIILCRQAQWHFQFLGVLGALAFLVSGLLSSCAAAA